MRAAIAFSLAMAEEYDEAPFDGEAFDAWLEYERRKRELVELDLAPADYERRLTALATELGL
jgi:hypothetical protein